MGGHEGFPLCTIYEQLLDIYDKGLRPFFLIDEVSMISGAMLMALSRALQEAEDVDRGIAFGGFPVMMFGDFGQLGPIDKAVEITDWLWKSDVYQSFHRMDLLQACRQSEDLEFKSMLDDIRRGELTPTTIKVFLQICNTSVPIPGDAVHLYPYKSNVEKVNRKKLDA